MSDHDDAKAAIVGSEAIVDREADVVLEAPSLIAQGYMRYERFELSINRGEEPALPQRRDVLRASRVAALLPVDLERGQLVLIRQFRLAAHLATGRGEMVEIVAGRIEPGEAAAAAARRECMEEIGVVPGRLVELYSVLPTPGLTDEVVTFFLGFVDAAQVPARAGAAEEAEDTRPFVVSIADAVAALEQGQVANGLLVTALQWLALHHGRLGEYFDRAGVVDPSS
jgi:ADP-ribose pyrophosphatase